MRLNVPKLLLGLVVSLSALAFGSPARAGFMYNQGITPAPGDLLSIHLTDFEPAPATVVGGGELFGVGTIDQILDLQPGSPNFGKAVWLPDAHQQLTFTFNNFAFDAANSFVSPVVDLLSFTGGALNVYFNSSPIAVTTPVAQGTNASPALNAPEFTAGALALTAVGNPAFTVTGDSLQSTIVPPTNTGSGAGELTVTGGSLAGFFTGSLALQTTLKPQPGATGSSYPIQSSDPITAHAGGATPEPTSLLAWSGLLLGLGIAKRRARRRSGSAG